MMHTVAYIHRYSFKLIQYVAGNKRVSKNGKKDDKISLIVTTE